MLQPFLCARKPSQNIESTENIGKWGDNWQVTWVCGTNWGGIWVHDRRVRPGVRAGFGWHRGSPVSPLASPAPPGLSWADPRSRCRSGRGRGHRPQLYKPRWASTPQSTPPRQSVSNALTTHFWASLHISNFEQVNSIEGVWFDKIYMTSIDEQTVCGGKFLIYNSLK